MAWKMGNKRRGREGWKDNRMGFVGVCRERGNTEGICGCGEMDGLQERVCEKGNLDGVLGEGHRET